MIRKYLTQQQYDDIDGKLNSNVDYVIVENGSPINVTFVTNNITGLDEMYDFAPTPEGSYNITENGEYDVAAYASAYVDVPMPEGSYNITENGEYDVAAYASAYVDVPMPEGTYNITENGEYDVTAYASAYVDVPMPEGSYNITENGEYDVTAYASAYVDVPSSDKWLPIYASSLEGTITALDGNTVPNDVSYIRPYAFYNYQNIASINVPLVEKIGNDAFGGCKALTSAYMPLVKQIGKNAFGICGALTSAYMPLVKEIGDNAFVRCGALTSAYMPLVEKIVDYAFNSCGALTSAYMPLVKEIGNNAFMRCGALTSAYMPLVKEIGIQCFRDCKALTSVELPSIEVLGSRHSNGEGPFFGCSSLAMVDIGPNVKYISQSTFAGCSALTSFTCRATTPPTLNKNTFSNTHADLVIYVPAESVDAYKAATNWSTYADRIQAIVE